jgi:pimeloyl-ACP methyl ester carboxylesterase
MATFVLVPGAWLGGCCWRHVVRWRRGAGHDAVAITLTGLAERAHLLTPAVGLDTHVDDVLGALVDKNLRDVVLVGHSCGGIVITATAGRERLRSLVYLDASVPANGQSNNDVLLPSIGAMVRDRAREGDGWRVPPPPAIEWELDADTRAWVVPRLTPHRGPGAPPRGGPGHAAAGIPTDVVALRRLSAVLRGGVRRGLAVLRARRRLLRDAHGAQGCGDVAAGARRRARGGGEDVRLDA